MASTFAEPNRPKPPRRVGVVELDRWPIEIQDAPVLCGRCGEPIVGTGQGIFGALKRLTQDHIRDKCSKRGVR